MMLLNGLPVSHVNHTKQKINLLMLFGKLSKMVMKLNMLCLPALTQVVTLMNLQLESFWDMLIL